MSVNASQSCKPHIFSLTKGNSCFICSLRRCSERYLGFEMNGFIALKKKKGFGRQRSE